MNHCDFEAYKIYKRTNIMAFIIDCIMTCVTVAFVGTPTFAGNCQMTSGILGVTCPFSETAAVWKYLF